MLISLVLLNLETAFMSTISWYKRYTDKLIDKMCEILKEKGKEKEEVKKEEVWVEFVESDL